MIKDFLFNIGMFYLIFGIFKVWDILFGLKAATSYYFLSTMPLAFIVAALCMWINSKIK